MHPTHAVANPWFPSRTLKAKWRVPLDWLLRASCERSRLMKTWLKAGWLDLVVDPKGLDLQTFFILASSGSVLSESLNPQKLKRNIQISWKPQISRLIHFAKLKGNSNNNHNSVAVSFKGWFRTWLFCYISLEPHYIQSSSLAEFPGSRLAQFSSFC